MDPQPHKDIKTLLNEALELKNVNHEKLAQLTGIPERYLWAIQNLEIDKLPSLPYVHGYIKKICEVLRLNHDELWELYKKELERKTSGMYDRLPMNRFAVKHLSKKTILLLTLGVLIVLYLLVNFRRIIGEPSLIITYPIESPIAVYENSIEMTGLLTQRDKLMINNEEIFITPDGTFSITYDLQPGTNTIKFNAKRFLGRDVTIIKEVLYAPTGAKLLNKK